MAQFNLRHIVTLSTFVLLVLVEESLAKKSGYDPEFIGKIRPLAAVFLVLVVVAALILIAFIVIVFRDQDNNNSEVEEKAGISKKSWKTTYAYNNKNYIDDNYYIDMKEGKKVPPSSKMEMRQTNGKQTRVDEQYDNPVYETAD